jgi:hypothetical protein
VIGKIGWEVETLKIETVVVLFALTSVGQTFSWKVIMNKLIKRLITFNGIQISVTVFKTSTN